MSKRKLIAFLIINILIVIFEIIGLIITFSEIGLKALQYYTDLSNIFLLVSAVINSIFAIRSILNKNVKIPKLAWNLFHASVSAATLTFLVVVFVLSWMYGDLLFVLTKSAMLYTHTICPLLGMICFAIFAPKIFTRKTALCVTGFTLLYALFAMTFNIARTWHGPYPFLYVYEQPIWASIAWGIGLLVGACGISRLLIIGKVRKKSTEERSDTPAKRTKNDLLFLVPILIIILLALPGIIYVVFYMQIDVNECDSPCRHEHRETCITLCSRSYTTFWRKITGQERL